MLRTLIGLKIAALGAGLVQPAYDRGLDIADMTKFSFKERVGGGILLFGINFSGITPEDIKRAQEYYGK